MAQDEHERAVKEALRTSELFKTLIGRLGTRQHPRGRILTAYRNARRALKGADGDVAALREILAELRATLMVIAQDTLWAAVQQGIQQAQAQTALYGLPGGLDGYTPTSELGSWMAAVDAQMAAVLGLGVTGRDWASIIGDESRIGALSPAPLIRDGANWLAIAGVTAVGVATLSAIDRGGARDDFGKQAVAAIDERTTECCLRVHGQVQPITEAFTLTGTPRYADELQEPPFHWYCRTATALVRIQDADDALSRAMRRAAIDEANARAETGVRIEIHPASATSTR
jgi:hypothetical protein